MALRRSQHLAVSTFQSRSADAKEMCAPRRCRRTHRGNAASRLADWRQKASRSSFRLGFLVRSAEPVGEILHLFLSAHDVLERKLRPTTQLLALRATPSGQTPVNRLVFNARHLPAFVGIRCRFYPAAGLRSLSCG